MYSNYLACLVDNLLKPRFIFENSEKLANTGYSFDISENDSFLYVVINSYLSVNAGRDVYDQHYIFSISLLRKLGILFQHIYGYGTTSTTSLECVVISLTGTKVTISWSGGVTNDNGLKYVGIF